MAADVAGASVLFVVPSFHTNLHHATRALVDAGARVTVLARSAAVHEGHSTVDAHVMGDDPSRAAVAAALSGSRPDLVVLRACGPLSDRVAALVRRGRARVLAYDLRSLTRRRSLGQRIGTALGVGPMHRVTPVPGLGNGAPADPGATFLPWPVAREDDVSRRPSDRFTVLCVGKLAQPRKNQPLLIDALRRAGLTDRVRLILAGSTARDVGGADAAQYRALCAAAAAGDWIDLRPDVPFGAMPDLYRSADVCVMPAVGEPLGMAPLEGMAFGCIPVISDQCGSAGYVTHGVDGFRVDVADPLALRNALTALADDADLRTRLSQGAVRTARTVLSPDRFVARVAALLPG